MAVEATSPLHTGEGPSALEARGVRLRYGRRGSAALDEVGMTVPRGSITALVGPNGAGKSSLMRSFVGFERPQRGSLSVLGHDIAKQRTEALACAGYLAQDSQLYRGLTVARHMDLVEGLRASFDRADAMVTLERMRIPLRVRAGDLSGGQQVLAALALVLATRAPVLILDEPLGALDVLARREFLALLVAEVRQRGTSVLMASHVIADMASTCDRVVAIAGGRVVLELGTAEALATHRLVGGTVAGTGVIGSFLGLDGTPMTLIRSGDQTLGAVLGRTLGGVLISVLLCGFLLLVGLTGVTGVVAQRVATWDRVSEDDDGLDILLSFREGFTVDGGERMSFDQVVELFEREHPNRDWDTWEPKHVQRWELRVTADQFPLLDAADTAGSLVIGGLAMLLTIPVVSRRRPT